MVQFTQKILQAAVIDTIKKTKNITYIQIAESIGVHNSHIQKVSKGLRLLSEDKFMRLCEIWGVNMHEISDLLVLDNEEYLTRKTIIALLKAEELDVKHLSEQTGISLLDLNQMQRGSRRPTEDEIIKMSEVLDVEADIIRDGQLAIILELFEKGLRLIHFPPSAIESVLEFIQAEI